MKKSELANQLRKHDNKRRLRLKAEQGLHLPPLARFKSLDCDDDIIVEASIAECVMCGERVIRLQDLDSFIEGCQEAADFIERAETLRCTACATWYADGIPDEELDS